MSITITTNNRERRMAPRPILAESEAWNTIRSASRVSREWRDSAIVDAAQQGFSVPEIAHAARLSPARVRQIVAASEQRA